MTPKLIVNNVIFHNNFTLVVTQEYETVALDNII